eukprot:660717-Alexandrium_andersonii.AAC.1
MCGSWPAARGAALCCATSRGCTGRVVRPSCGVVFFVLARRHAGQFSCPLPAVASHPCALLL